MYDMSNVDKLNSTNSLSKDPLQPLHLSIANTSASSKDSHALTSSGYFQYSSHSSNTKSLRNSSVLLPLCMPKRVGMNRLFYPRLSCNILHNLFNPSSRHLKQWRFKWNPSNITFQKFYKRFVCLLQLLQ